MRQYFSIDDTCAGSIDRNRTLARVHSCLSTKRIEEQRADRCYSSADITVIIIITIVVIISVNAHHRHHSHRHCHPRRHRHGHYYYNYRL